MGMMINRRRVMGGKDVPNADTYIQNGLIFQLDGIDYGSVSGHWIDRKQSIDILLDATYSQRTADSVILENNSSSPIAMFGNKPIEGVTYNNNTVEVCLKNWSSKHAVFRNNVILLSTQTSQGPWLRVRNANDGLSCVFYTAIDIKRGFKFDNTDLQKILLSINSSAEVVFRGNSYNAISQHEGYAADVAAGIAVSGRVSYELCALRVYDRALSIQEMQYNQRVDNARFNLGLNI